MSHQFIERPQWEEVFDYTCKHCFSQHGRRIYGPHPGGHYARIECGSCDRFIKWEGKPDSEKKNASRKNQAKLLNRFGRGFCELCLRPGDSLPLPQVLEAHHIIPVEDGGGDERENIQIVCTACHRLIHHQRTYLGHYQAPARSEGVA